MQRAVHLMCDGLSPEQLAAVVAPFRRATASRLIDKHRGTRWLIEKAFQEDPEACAHSSGEQPPSPCRNSGAGALARRRLESGAWVPWAPGASISQPSRALPSFSSTSPTVPSCCWSSSASSRLGTIAKAGVVPDAGGLTARGSNSSSQVVCKDEAAIAVAEAAAVGRLSSRLRDSDEHVRWRAARALSALGEGAASGAQATLLAGCVGGEANSSVRWAAAEALGRAGPATVAAPGGSIALETLARSSLEDPNRVARWAAADAVARVQASSCGAGSRSAARQAPEVGVPPLRVMLRSDGAWQRRS